MPLRENRALEALAEALARKVAREKSGKPELRIVRAPSVPKPSRYDAITRNSITTRVRYLSRAYQLQWLVDQATFNIACVEGLSDDELCTLLRDLERARECIADGVSFEDAGLVRDTSDML